MTTRADALAPAAPVAGKKTRGGVSYAVLSDHIGRPAMTVLTTGTITWDAVYRPFGQIYAATGTVPLNLRFPGQYYDAETGLHYNYFRDYDPTTGRYVESDPIGLRGGWNTYAYVGGNPVMRVDAKGLIDLFFERSSGALTAYLDNGIWLTSCRAANNTTDSSRGPWKDGVYYYDYSKIHPENTTSYGSYGIHVFDYPPIGDEDRRTGMGVHSGRSGPESKTEGCIRTTDDCMGYISFINATYEPIRSITVYTAVADVGG